MTAIDAVVAAARGAKLPVFTSIPGSAERGALFDVGANHYEVGRIAGALAARVLRGTDPATVAIENVMPEWLIVNRQALQGLKDPWTVPAAVARRAQFVGETTTSPAAREDVDQRPATSNP
jgi:putative ABC transport system substrate-binding protein